MDQDELLLKDVHSGDIQGAADRLEANWEASDRIVAGATFLIARMGRDQHADLLNRLEQATAMAKDMVESDGKVGHA